MSTRSGLPPLPPPPARLAALQRAFMAHLRDPSAAPPPPDVEPRRMQLYARLFRDSLRNLLAPAFPVLRRVLGDDRWTDLLRDFLARHACRAPLFHQVAGEFVQFLQAQRRDAGDPPFLAALAHWEWVELALAVDPADHADRAADPQGDLLDGVPVLSPLAWLQAYDFPVHRISAAFQPQLPGPPVHLLAWRDRADAVRFMELNAGAAALLAALQAEPASGRELLARMARQLGTDPARVARDGAALLERWRDAGVILGTRP